MENCYQQERLGESSFKLQFKSETNYVWKKRNYTGLVYIHVPLIMATFVPTKFLLKDSC